MTAGPLDEPERDHAITARPLVEHERGQAVDPTSPITYPPPPARVVPARAAQPAPSDTGAGLGGAGDVLLCRTAIYFVAVLLLLLFVVLIVYALAHAAASAPPAATQHSRFL